MLYKVHLENSCQATCTMDRDLELGSKEEGPYEVKHFPELFKYSRNLQISNMDLKDIGVYPDQIFYDRQSDQNLRFVAIYLHTFGFRCHPESNTIEPGTDQIYQAHIRN